VKFFRISKWETYQHYHQPRPKWLKVYTTINDFDTDWRGLSDAELGQLVRLMAYAALHENTIPHDATLLQEILELDSPLHLDKFSQLGVITVFPDKASCLSREKSRLNSREKSSVPSSEIRVQSSEGRDQNKKKKKKPGRLDDARVVLAYLVEKTGRSFGASSDFPVENIEKCLVREKATVEDCKLVIDYKLNQWAGTDLVLNVNPTTPFRPCNFQKYLDEAKAGPGNADVTSEAAAEARMARLREKYGEAI
jgi:uncharacterized phage protein (TIGR02220 family)